MKDGGAEKGDPRHPKRCDHRARSKAPPSSGSCGVCTACEIAKPPAGEDIQEPTLCEVDNRHAHLTCQGCQVEVAPPQIATMLDGAQICAAGVLLHERWVRFEPRSAVVEMLVRSRLCQPVMVQS